MKSADDLDDVTIGARVRAGRTAMGLTLRELAIRLHVSPATMSALENGKTGIGLTRLQQIAGVLGLSVSDLLRERQEPPGGAVPAARRGARSTVDGDWRAYGPLQLDPVLAAALAAIRDKGYHGCTVREIAERADLSVPGIYHHYRSKQDMLVALLDLTMEDLLRRSLAARDAGATAAERFALIIESVALYHSNRPELAFLGASEMRSLLPHSRTRIAALRRDQQQMVDDEVNAAIADGTFTTARHHDASRAVVTMCTALPQWFDPNGPASPQDIATLYVGFALDLMGAAHSVARDRVAEAR